MHLRLRELANPSNPPLTKTPYFHHEDTLNKSVHSFSEFLKAEFLNSYHIYGPNLSVMSVQILINSDCVFFVPHKIMMHLNCTHSNDSLIK